MFGLSWSDRGEGWAGIGASYTWRHAESGVFLRGSLMPGLYRAGAGQDLGGPFQIRTMLEVGIPLGRGELALGIDHRSNAGIYRENPGMETLSLTYTIPLHWRPGPRR